jgi:hypothetical protein
MNDATQFFDTVAGGGGYEIERSLRFNSSDSAYLSRTPASAGNRKTWTWAGWVKRCRTGGDGDVLFSAYSGSINQDLYITFVNASTSSGPTDAIALFSPPAANNIVVVSNAIYRDHSAWYHIVAACDTTQATAANRVKIYVNGTEVTYNVTTYPSQDQDLNVNNTQPHALGSRPNGISAFFSGYLADVHFIDGQALDPTSFTEFDDNGVLQPKAYAGSYGTNGFHLPFSDNSTAAALGTDTSGNGNTWTVNNIAAFNVTKSGAGSVTAGAPFNSSFPWTTALDGAIDLTGAVSNASGANSFVWTFANTLTGTTAAFVVHDTYVPDFDTGNKAAINGTALTSSNWTKTTNTLPVASGVPGDYKVYTYSLGGSPLSTVGVGNAVRIAAVLLDGIPVIFDVTGTNDSLVDSPTNYGTDTGAGGEVRGNYATLNPLLPTLTPTNGNLDTPNSVGQNYSTIAVSTGKWYVESTVGPITPTTTCGLGVHFNPSAESGAGYYDSGAYIGLLYSTTLARYEGVNSGVNFTVTASSGDILAIRLDLDSGTQTISYYLNNTLITSSNLPSGKTWFITTRQTNNQSLNFGQRPFAYTAPSGFKALCTTNLAEPTIADGSTAMDVATYTGNSSTQTISGLNFSPDFVWIKERSGANQHNLVDAVRGAAYRLRTNATSADEANRRHIHV